MRVDTYPELIRAAEAPVIDTSCAALLKLAARVHACGQKVVLTGEGSDEWMIGYPWYKAAKAISYLDILPGLRLSDLARRSYLRLNNVPQYPKEFRRKHRSHDWEGRMPGSTPMGCSGFPSCVFYSESMHEVRKERQSMGGPPDAHRAREALAPAEPRHLGGRPGDPSRVSCSRPRGDRVAMHSSVEVRYPFLDEAVFDFLAPFASGLEAARISGQTYPALARGALGAGARLQSPQSHFPRAAGQLPPGP